MSKMSAIVNGIVVCMDRQRNVLNKGHIVIRDDVIVDVASDIEVLEKYHIDEWIEANNKVVFPGLINTHMHMRPARGWGDQMSTPEWHTEYVDRISELMDWDDAYYGAKSAFTELISGGTTTVLGMTINGEAEHYSASELGIRARFVPHAEAADQLEAHLDGMYLEDGSESDLVRNWIGMEAASIFSEQQLADIRQCANKTGKRIHTHYSEWEKEPFKPLMQSNLLGKDLILAHCVHVNSEEIAVLAENDVSISHNPKSNMRLGSGIAPIMPMRQKNINISLGTDGPLSTYKLDMWEEMRTAAMLQRLYDSRALSSWDVLEMATINGAKALGMEDQIGSIEKGKKADIILINFENVHTAPFLADGPHQNLAPLLVFAVSQADVETVFVNGRILMRNNEIMNVDKADLIKKVNDAGKRIMGYFS